MALGALPAPAGPGALDMIQGDPACQAVRNEKNTETA